MKPLVPAIEDLLKRKVTFLNNCVGPEVEKECREAKEGRVILLENLRFHLSEEGKGVVNGEKVKASKDEIAAFRKSLSSLGDIFVNDAFGTALSLSGQALIIGSIGQDSFELNAGGVYVYNSGFAAVSFLKVIDIFFV